ncbi:hypothetical protein ACTTAL_11135 [Rhodobacter capsulatus]|uniref:hypothetical protein n=1 Tax=Rhodobacter capsulatus TaxID=1061 RepID=UPI0003D31BB4|nr:hypothetical protein [Rhodobacter capsulatus]ETD89026.1 hypothetical protein U713_11205 [Rhodobacter capsulatus YW2]
MSTALAFAPLPRAALPPHPAAMPAEPPTALSLAPSLRRAWAAVLRSAPPSHLLTTAILALLWSGVFLWRFA